MNKQQITALILTLPLALIGCSQPDPRAHDPACRRIELSTGVDYLCNVEPFTGESAAYKAEQRALNNVADKINGKQTHDWDGAEAQEIKRQAFAECKETPSASFCE